MNRTRLEDQPTPSSRSWPRRRAAGLLLRGLTVVVPFLLGIGVIVVGSRQVPAADGGLAVLRFVGITATSWLLMWLTHRILNRSLPLAVLLEMSLVFPEKAPSRMKLARRVASKRDLEDLLAGRHPNANETTQQAAERILALVGALSIHDRGTRGHSERVRVLSDLIAERMRLPEYDRERLRWAALLHDIGKLHVPVEILNKPAKPTQAEWEVLKRHPEHGDEMIAPLRKWLGPYADVVVQHHERWDGDGYPKGLAGEGICLGARIVNVADAFDVMTAARAYKKAHGRGAALRELVRCSSGQFDPTVVRALLTIPRRRLLLSMGPAAWLTSLPFIGQGQAALTTHLANQAGVAVGTVALTGSAIVAPSAAGAAPATLIQTVAATVDQVATGQATPGAPAAKAAAPAAPKAARGKAAKPTAAPAAPSTRSTAAPAPSRTTSTSQPAKTHSAAPKPSGEAPATTAPAAPKAAAPPTTKAPATTRPAAKPPAPKPAPPTTSAPKSNPPAAPKSNPAPTSTQPPPGGSGSGSGSGSGIKITIKVDNSGITVTTNQNGTVTTTTRPR